MPEPELRLPWHSNQPQLLIQGALRLFESSCTLLYNSRLGCLILSHISPYADWDLIDTR